jgi:hypothetical protein
METIFQRGNPMLLFRRRILNVAVLIVLLGLNAETLCTAQLTMAAGDCRGNRETGTPLLFPARNSIAYGISVKQQDFLLGEPIPVYVWIDNRSETPFLAGSCDMFSNWNIAVWNSSGRRLLSSAEQRHIIEGASCDSNVLIEVRPHVCMRVNRIDAADSYALIPGQYRIAELPWPTNESDSRHPAAPTPSTTESLLLSVNSGDTGQARLY